MKDETQTDYMKINRRVPQGTILDPVLISVMIDDIKPANPQNGLVKPYNGSSREDYRDTLMIKIGNIEDWSKRNIMHPNMKHMRWSFVETFQHLYQLLAENILRRSFRQI